MGKLRSDKKKGGTDISSARNAKAKGEKLRAFINHVDSQRGKALTAAQADELIALAQAV
jgi:hypothetical protein